MNTIVLILATLFSGDITPPAGLYACDIEVTAAYDEIVCYTWSMFVDDPYEIVYCVISIDDNVIWELVDCSLPGQPLIRWEHKAIGGHYDAEYGIQIVLYTFDVTGMPVERAWDRAIWR